MSSTPRRPRTLAVMAAIVAIALAPFLAASPAAAHDTLLASNPAAGSSVAALPGEITLTFSAELFADESGNRMEVTDAVGTSLTDGPATVTDNTLVQPLAGAASGAIKVLWRAVSSDGHPISGEFTFEVLGTTPSPATTPAPSPTVTVTSPAETASPAPVLPEPSANPLPWIITAIVAGIAVVVVLLLLTRGRRREGPAGGAPGPDAER